MLASTSSSLQDRRNSDFNKNTFYEQQIIKYLAYGRMRIIPHDPKEWKNEKLFKQKKFLLYS